MSTAYHVESDGKFIPLAKWSYNTSAHFDTVFSPIEVKNISMEILDFYESHRMFSDDRINAALQKLALRP
ncbi:hypothetical protein ACSQ67_014614 [Phaseolus vulgaris]